MLPFVNEVEKYNNDNYELMDKERISVDALSKLKKIDDGFSY